MIIVLDNNCLFSILKPYTLSSYLFASVKARFIAPEFIKKELNEHKKEYLNKSNLSEQEFEFRQKEIEEYIEFFDEESYDKYLDIAMKNLKDPKDSPYLALALLTNSIIWSNDLHLKEQSLIPVFTTAELMEKFLSGDL